MAVTSVGTAVARTLNEIVSKPRRKMCMKGFTAFLRRFGARCVGATALMASDGNCGSQPNFQGFSLPLSVSGEAEAERLFAALGDGEQLQMLLARTLFSPRFGKGTDRFGVSWIIIVEN